MNPIKAASESIHQALHSVANAQFAILAMQQFNGDTGKAIQYSQALQKIEKELGGFLFCLGLERLSLEVKGATREASSAGEGTSSQGEKK